MLTGYTANVEITPQVIVGLRDARDNRLVTVHRQSNDIFALLYTDVVVFIVTQSIGGIPFAARGNGGVGPADGGGVVLIIEYQNNLQKSLKKRFILLICYMYVIFFMGKII